MSGAGGGAGVPARAGRLFLLLGAALLLRRLGASGVLFELAWFALLFWGANSAWRLLGRVRPPATPQAEAQRLGLFLAGFALLAITTLSRLAWPALLGTLALSAWLLYSRPGVPRPRATGLVIVTGLLVTLTLVAGVGALFPRWDTGALFFLGMTATFTLLYLLPRERGGTRWALWPALVWAALTLAVNDPAGGLARWVVPLALIGAGVAWVGYRHGKR